MTELATLREDRAEWSSSAMAALGLGIYLLGRPDDAEARGHIWKINLTSDGKWCAQTTVEGFVRYVPREPAWLERGIVTPQEVYEASRVRHRIMTEQPRGRGRAPSS